VARYTVIIRGTKDNSESGKNIFLESFATSYRMGVEQARNTINNQKGAVYDFDDYEKAEKACTFLESIGGLTIIRDNIEKKAPADPPGKTPEQEEGWKNSDSSYAHLFRVRNEPQVVHNETTAGSGSEQNNPWHIQTPEIIDTNEPRHGKVYNPNLTPSGNLPIKTVFKPLSIIKFPDRCIGCYCENPVNIVAISVLPAAAAASGKALGAIGKGKFGAIVGGTVGRSIFGNKEYKLRYNVPICQSCLTKLSDKKRKLLAGDSDSVLFGTYKIDTFFVDREIEKECVVLTFYNNMYGAKFTSINRAYVYESVDLCMAGIPQRKSPG